MLKAPPKMNLSQSLISKKLRIPSTKKTQSATPHFFQLGLLSAFLHCHYCWIHRWWPSSTHAAMKCQLRDLQLLAIVELGESCSSAFSKGHNVIISHLRRERQRVQGKESLLSETLLWTNLIQQKRRENKSRAPEVKASSDKISSWLELRCNCGDFLPTNRPRGEVSWGGEFLLPELPCQKKERSVSVQPRAAAPWGLGSFPLFLFSQLRRVVRTRCVCADNRKGCEGWIPGALLCKHITGAISIKGESLPDGQARGLFPITCNFIEAHKNAGCPFSPSSSLNSSKLTGLLLFFFLSGVFAALANWGT